LNNSLLRPYFKLIPARSQQSGGRRRPDNRTCKQRMTFSRHSVAHARGRTFYSLFTLIKYYNRLILIFIIIWYLLKTERLACPPLAARGCGSAASTAHHPWRMGGGSL
jgi:hypothetical protein